MSIIHFFGAGSGFGVRRFAGSQVRCSQVRKFAVRGLPRALPNTEPPNSELRRFAIRCSQVRKVSYRVPDSAVRREGYRTPEIPKHRIPNTEHRRFAGSRFAGSQFASSHGGLPNTEPPNTELRWSAGSPVRRVAYRIPNHRTPNPEPWPMPPQTLRFPL